MIKKTLITFTLIAFALGCTFAQQSEKLIYHDIKTDKAGNIIP
jgi:hypothetical protein